jgi:hypothetical protein
VRQDLWKAANLTLALGRWERRWQHVPMLYLSRWIVLTVAAAVGCGSVSSPPSMIDAATAIDAAPNVDAAPDAAPRIYDVAYGSTWEFNVNQAVPGWITLINTGTAALDLSTLRVVSVSDEHPTMNLTASVNAVTTRLGVGQVGGHLTPVSRRVTVEAGLVTEPTVDTSADYVTFDLLNFSDSNDVTFNGTITLEIAGRRVELPMTFHVSPLTGPVLFEPSLGRRVSAP